MRPPPSLSEEQSTVAVLHRLLSSPAADVPTDLVARSALRAAEEAAGPNYQAAVVAEPRAVSAISSAGASGAAAELTGPEVAATPAAAASPAKAAEEATRYAEAPQRPVPPPTELEHDVALLTLAGPRRATPSLVGEEPGDEQLRPGDPGATTGVCPPPPPTGEPLTTEVRLSIPSGQ